MKSLFLAKLNQLDKKYTALSKVHQRLILIAVFVLSLLWVLDLVLLQSLDKFRIANNDVEQLFTKKNDFLKEKEKLLLQKAYSSEKGLLKRRTEILFEIEHLLKSNKNSNYISSENVAKLIKDIVEKVNNVNVISFKNVVSPTPNHTEPNSSILIKHKFNLKVEGGFQDIYELIIKIENINGLNLSVVDIKKEENGKIIASFDFYVLNTNKNVINF